VIEEKILMAEIQMQKQEDFNPMLEFTNVEENWHLQALLILK
jgi:hypothetical protein